MATNICPGCGHQQGPTHAQYTHCPLNAQTKTPHTMTPTPMVERTATSAGENSRAGSGLFVAKPVNTSYRRVEPGKGYVPFTTETRLPLLVSTAVAPTVVTDNPDVLWNNRKT